MKSINVEGILNLSFNEFGFQEVIDDLPNASYVYVITYNVSKKENKLLESLKQIKNIPVTIVTNIPGRFEQYFGRNAEQLAKSAFRSISNYLARLDSVKFDCDLRTFFNFDNHSKIIMTDNICYIGSANFSDESANNYESGIVIKDRVTINKIKNELVENIIKDSILFSTSYYPIFKEFAIELINKCQEEIVKLENGLFTSLEVQYCKEEIVLDYYNAYLPTGIFEEFYSLYEDCSAMCNEIYYNFQNMLNMDKINKLLYIIEGQIEEINNIMRELVNFKFMDCQMDYAEKLDYYHTGDPEDLQKAIEDGAYFAQEQLEKIVDKYHNKEGFIRRWVIRIPKLFEMLIDELDTIDDEMRDKILYKNEGVINNTGL